MSSIIDAVTTIYGSLDTIEQLQSFTILTATFNGIMIWELVTCFPSEVKHIFWPEFRECLLEKKLPAPGSVLLFSARVLAPPIVGVSYAMIAPPGGMGMSGDLNSLFKGYVLLFSAAVLNGTAVFVIRTLAIRDSKRPMTVFLWCCYAIVCIFHLCCASLIKMPSDFFSPASTLITPLDQYLPWILFVACGVVFDVLVLALSIAPQMEGFTKWKPTYSRIAKKFYFDAIVYFGLSLFVSIFDLAWIIAHRYHGILVALATPVHIWLMVSISPRVIRNLRLHTAKQKTGASPQLSRGRSPFASELESLPYTAPLKTPTTTFIISKERTTVYPSSLYSESNLN